jgi:hypothetical protein
MKTIAILAILAALFFIVPIGDWLAMLVLVAVFVALSSASKRWPDVRSFLDWLDDQW